MSKKQKTEHNVIDLTLEDKRELKTTHVKWDISWREHKVDRVAESGRYYCRKRFKAGDFNFELMVFPFGESESKNNDNSGRDDFISVYLRLLDDAPVGGLKTLVNFESRHLYKNHFIHRIGRVFNFKNKHYDRGFRRFLNHEEVSGPRFSVDVCVKPYENCGICRNVMKDGTRIDFMKSCYHTCCKCCSLSWSRSSVQQNNKRCAFCRSIQN